MYFKKNGNTMGGKKKAALILCINLWSTSLLFKLPGRCPQASEQVLALKHTWE